MSGAENGWYRDEYRKARSFDDLSSSASSSAANSPFVQKRPGRRQHYASVDSVGGGMPSPGSPAHYPRLPSITYIRADDEDVSSRSLPRSTRVHIAPDRPDSASLPRHHRHRDEPLYANLGPRGRPPPPAKPPRKASPQSGPPRRLPADLRRQMESRRRAAAGLPLLDSPRADSDARRGERRTRSESEGDRREGREERRAAQGEMVERRNQSYPRPAKQYQHYEEDAHRQRGGQRRGSLDGGRSAAGSDSEHDAEPAGSGNVFRRFVNHVRGRSPDEKQTHGKAGNSVVLLNGSPPPEFVRGRSPGARRQRVRSPPPPPPLTSPVAPGRPVARVSSLGRYDREPDRRRPRPGHHHQHPPDSRQRDARGASRGHDYGTAGMTVNEYDVHRRAVDEALRLPLGLPGLRSGEVTEYIEIPRHYNERAIDVDGEPASQSSAQGRLGNEGAQIESRESSKDRLRPSPPRHGDKKEKRIEIEMESESTGLPPGMREKPVDLTAISSGRSQLLPHDFSSLPRPSQLRKRNRYRNRANNTTVVSMNADYATLPRRPQTSKIIISSSSADMLPDAGRADATLTHKHETEVRNPATVEPRVPIDADDIAPLDRSKIQPESDDYKLVFISSDSCKESEHNSSMELDSPRPVGKRRGGPYWRKFSQKSKQDDESWDNRKVDPKSRSDFVRSLLREPVTPTKSRAGSKTSRSTPRVETSSISQKFTPIQGNSSKILFIFDDEPPSTSELDRSKHQQPDAGKAWAESVDFGDNAALSSMMHQTERMQAEAEALQSALLSTMERPSALRLGEVMAGLSAEPDATLERCRNLVLSEIRHHRRDGSQPGEGAPASVNEPGKGKDGQKIVYGDHCVKVIIAGDGGDSGKGDKKTPTFPSGFASLPRMMHKSVTRITPTVSRSKSFSAPGSEEQQPRRKPQRHFSLHDRPQDRSRKPLVRRDPNRNENREPSRTETLEPKTAAGESKPLHKPSDRSVADGQEPVDTTQREPSWVSRPATEQRTDPSGASSSDDDERANRQKRMDADADGAAPVSAPAAISPLHYRAGQVTSGDVVQYFERLTRAKSEPTNCDHKSTNDETMGVQSQMDETNGPDEVNQPAIVPIKTDIDAASVGSSLLPPAVENENDCISLTNLTEVPVDSEPEISSETAQSTTETSSVATLVDDSVADRIESCTQETSVDVSDSELTPTASARAETVHPQRPARGVHNSADESESRHDDREQGPADPAPSGAGVKARWTHKRPPHAEKPPDDDREVMDSDDIPPELPPKMSHERKKTKLAGKQAAAKHSLPAAKTGSEQASGSGGPPRGGDGDGGSGGSADTGRNSNNSECRSPVEMGVSEGIGAEVAMSTRPVPGAPLQSAGGGTASNRPAWPRPAIPAKPAFVRDSSGNIARCAAIVTPTPGAAETSQSITSTPAGAAVKPCRGGSDAAPGRGAAVCEGHPEKNRTCAGDLKASTASAVAAAEVTDSGERASAPHGASRSERAFVSVIAVADSAGAVVSDSITAGDSADTLPAGADSAHIPDKSAQLHRRASVEEVEVVTDEKTNSFLVAPTSDNPTTMAAKSELQTLIARSREAQGEFVYTGLDREHSPESSSKLADYFAGLDSPIPSQTRRSASHRTPEVRRHQSRSPDRRGSESPLSEPNNRRQEDIVSGLSDQPTSLEASESDARHSDAQLSDQDVASDDFDDGFDFGGDEEFRDDFDGHEDQFDSDGRYSAEESFSDGSYPDEAYQEEDSRYTRPIDFTLTTILEESCEESDDGRSSKDGASTAHPSEFEKYFLFDLGNGPPDPIKYANEESEYSDTFSETTDSVYSEMMDQEETDLDPVQQASQRYFTKGFLGLPRRLSPRSAGGDSENPTDGSGSVGSDSEGAVSPQPRRKRRSRSRPRAPPVDAGGGGEPTPPDQQTGEVTSSDDDATGREMLHDPTLQESGSISHDWRSQKSKLLANHRNGEKLELDALERARLAVSGVQSSVTVSVDTSKLTDRNSRTSGCEQNRVVPGHGGLVQCDKTGEVHQSRDSGFLGSSDDLLKEAVIKEAEERSGGDGSTRITSDSSFSDDGRKQAGSSVISSKGNTDMKNAINHRPMQSSSPTANQTVEAANPSLRETKPWLKLSRKDSFNWSSDEETNQLMSRLRELFRTALNNASRTPEPFAPATPSPLAALEDKLTQLMRTVPGISDAQVQRIVEYLSSEDTWSGSGDSSDYAGSDLEGACAALNPAQPDIMTQFHKEIAESCQHVIRLYEPDVIADIPSLRLPYEQFSRRTGRVSETRSPPMLVEAMRHVGSRLIALMEDVSSASAVCTATEDSSSQRLFNQDNSVSSTHRISRTSYLAEQFSQQSSEVTCSLVSALKSEPGEREFNRILRDSQRRKKKAFDSFQTLPESLVSPEERERMNRLCDRLRSSEGDISLSGSTEDTRMDQSVASDSPSIGPRAGFGRRGSSEHLPQRRISLPEPTDKRSTLPRSAVLAAPPNTTGSLSLPRRSVTAPHLGVSSLAVESRSARYRPPGFRPIPPSARRSASARRITPPANTDVAAASAASAGPSADGSPSPGPSPGPRRPCSVPPPGEVAGADHLTMESQTTATAMGSRSSSLASLYSAAESRFGTVAVRGDIRLAVRYRASHSLLELAVKECRHLAAADLRRNKSDPYVKVYLLPDRTKLGKRKTKTKKHSLNPVFEEVLTFPVGAAELAGRTLWVSVWHSDMFGRNHFLGEVLLPLEESLLDQPTPTWYTLQERSELHEESAAAGRGHGDLIVALKFDPPPAGARGRTRARGTLHVMVKEAKHLQAIRSNGSADPFCKCYLLPDRKSSKQKTSVVRRSTSPRWSGALAFGDVTATELRQRALELTVWDHSLTNNELLGAARLNTGSGQHNGHPAAWMDASGQEVSLWEQMLERPGFWVEGSVPLRPSMEPGAVADK